MTNCERLLREIASFSNLWKGGYYEGDPLNPMSISSYGVLGYISSLYAIYLTCIKPYINENSVVCEIGCGRGAWTKTFLNAKEVWCLDVLSAEHNIFWEYVGHHDHVKYCQINDFSCEMLPENKFNYIFSFGCFCHISFEGITEYMKNLFPKLLPGTHGFIMIADYDKFNNAKAKEYEYIYQILPVKLRPIFKIYNGIESFFRPNEFHDKNENNTISPGRWYHAGIDRTCEMLCKFNYDIVEADVNANIRDPIIHFIKP